MANRADLSLIGVAAAAITLMFVSAQLFVVNGRVNRLTGEVATLSARIGAAQGVGIPVIGEALTSTNFTAIDGRESHLPLGNRLLVFVVSPSCEPCVDSLPDLSHMYRSALRREYVIAVSSADFRALERFRETYTLSVPLYSVPSVWLTKHNLTTTPTVLIVSGNGMVEHVWAGVGTIAREKNQILRRFEDGMN